MDATTTRREIDSLVRRRLVILEDGMLQPRIRLFGLWIAGNGQTQMVLTSVELESARSAIDQREKLRVSLDEARKLIQGWGSFRGTTISAERLLCYLEQFGDVRSQRLIFQILVKAGFHWRCTRSRVDERGFSSSSEQYESSARQLDKRPDHDFIHGIDRRKWFGNGSQFCNRKRFS